MNFDDLKKPFAPERISWRLGSTNGEKTKGMALAYIDARDVMGRLDEVCGLLWQAEYVPMPNGTCCCRIGVKIGDEWVWRSNGAMSLADSDKIDAKEMAEKGSYSDAFKRAAVLWGVGQYLYDLDSPWVEIEPAGRSYKIKADQYAKLRAVLGGIKTVETPGPKQKMTPAEWVHKAEAELLILRRPAEMTAWLQKNSAAIDALQDKDKALYNAINQKIMNRNDELQRVAA